MKIDNLFTIVKNIVVLSEKDNITKELNIIKYRDLTNTILDIRKWDNADANKKMLRGLTLTENEARKLKDALNDYFNNSVDANN